MAYLRRIKKKYRKAAAELTVFTISIEDINKALCIKVSLLEGELYKRISPEFYNLLPLFIKKEADKLNLYKLGVDHEVNLKTDKRN